MKKLLFSAYSLDLGGIETALVTLTNYLVKKDYEITIVLEKKEGIFLNKLDKKIKVLEYTPSENKNIVIRKIENLKKRIEWNKKYHNYFDFSACFATYSKAGGMLARTSSKNTAIWGHADYYELFNHNEKDLIKFFKERKVKKFKHIIFVSEEGKNSFLKAFPDCKNKTITCNNMIDAKNILKMSNEEIEIEKNSFTFVNVGRHDERQKKLSRLIDSAKKLKDENKKFKIWLIGEGPDTEKYKKMVKEKNLSDYILFLGKKKNPYPYYKKADCVVLTSEYEGYPVVFLESKVLNKPIITTKVSDYKDIENKFGIVVEKEAKDIACAMEKVLDNGYEIKEKFDYKKINQEIEEKLSKIF